MDRGAGEQQPPYWAAYQLASWGAANWGWVNGELLRAGHPPGTLDGLELADVLDLLLALLVERRSRLGTDQLAAAMEVLAKPPFNVRESWGATPDAAPGARAMMRMAGGPAPMRQDGDRPQRPRPAQEGGDA